MLTNIGALASELESHLFQVALGRSDSDRLSSRGRPSECNLVDGNGGCQVQGPSVKKARMYAPCLFRGESTAKSQSRIRGLTSQGEMHLSSGYARN